MTKAEWQCRMHVHPILPLLRKKKKDKLLMSVGLYVELLNPLAAAVLFFCIKAFVQFNTDHYCFTENSLNTTKCTACYKWPLFFHNKRSTITAHLTPADWKWTLAHLRNQLVNPTKRHKSFALVFVNLALRWDGFSPEVLGSLLWAAVWEARSKSNQGAAW